MVIRFSVADVVEFRFLLSNPVHFQVVRCNVMSSLCRELIVT